MERNQHSTVRVGDYLYMWGGNHLALPEVHDNEWKKSMSLVMEVCHLASGRWEQKPTTGTPPLGEWGYASAVIGREILFFGGYCSHPGCYQNSLFSFNVDTFNWKEFSSTSPHHGPMMKKWCGMVAVQLEREAYLVVIILEDQIGKDNNLVLNVVLSMKVVAIFSIVMRFIITSYHQVSIINYHEVLCS